MTTEYTRAYDRASYLDELRHYLRKLPREDFDNAIGYFEEYFDDAGAENEQQVIAELGDPKEAATELLHNLLAEDGDVAGGKGEVRTVKIALMAFLLSPLGWLGLLIAVPLLFAGVVSILAVVFAAVVSAGAIFFASGLVLWQGVSMLGSAAAGGCILLGYGLLGLGGGVLCAALLLFLCRLIARGMTKLVRWLATKTRRV